IVPGFIEARAPEGKVCEPCETSLSKTLKFRLLAVRSRIHDRITITPGEMHQNIFKRSYTHSYDAGRFPEHRGKCRLFGIIRCHAVMKITPEFGREMLLPLIHKRIEVMPKRFLQIMKT